MSHDGHETRVLEEAHRTHSRIFSTATRSSVSSRRLTMSADTSAAAMMPRNAQRNRLTRDVQRESVHLALHRLHDRGRHPVAEQGANRQRRQRQERELAEQNQRNLRRG